MDELDTTQQHACHTNRTNPQDGTQDVPEVEPAAWIRRNTRRQRNKGTNDWYEATYNKCETASFSKKFFRGVQVLGAQDFCIVFEKITAIAGTQLIPDLAASYRCNDKNRERQPERQPHAVVEHTQSEDQRVARKHRKQHARFDKNDDGRNHQNPRTGADQHIFKLETEEPQRQMGKKYGDKKSHRKILK